MKIFMAHNYYQQPGGEDRSFAAEADVLEANGHTVHRYTRHNDDIKAMGRAKLAKSTFWNSDTYRELRDLFEREKFDIAHFQNTFPLISPAAYHAARDAGVPVVQHLRNYRLICPAATLFRAGAICTKCVGKTPPLPSVQHRCYHDSAAQTAVIAGMLTFHRWRRTYDVTVNHYIALTEFVRGQYLAGGFGASQISVKPNFLSEDPGPKQEHAGYMLYVGRLLPEKGVMTLLRAWEKLPHIPLKVVGDGPSFDEMRAYVAAQNLTHVDMMGRRPADETLGLMRTAYGLVVPSAWYEPFGRVAVEAYACSVPVIASNIGGVASIVEDGRTGLQFRAGDIDDLAAKVTYLWENPQKVGEMGLAARAAYEEQYTPEQNYRQLIDIYQRVLSE